jgi:hypothetical protein
MKGINGSAPGRSGKIGAWIARICCVLAIVPSFINASMVAATLTATIPATALATDDHRNDNERSEERHPDGRRNDNKPGEDRDANEDRGRQGVVIVLKDVAASAWDDGRSVGVQVQLKNEGRAIARDVRVTRVLIEGGAYQGPVTLPVSLGDLPTNEDVLLDAVLTLPAVNGTSRLLTVEGTYRGGDDGGHFRLQSPINPDVTPPGPFPSIAGEAVKLNPNSVAYPPAPPPATFGPNAESPIFVPVGPLRQIFPATPEVTALGTSAGAASVQIARNTTMRNAGLPPDPAVGAATANGVVLATYNTGISVSMNGGQTFTDINLFGPNPAGPADTQRTSFFPRSDGDLCCDQVVLFLPNQNLFVWLLQYNMKTAPPQPPATYNVTASNRLRIAWATPDAIAADFWNAWTYADLTGTRIAGVSDGLGIVLKSGSTDWDWVDYPDLAWSDTYLYVAVDRAFGLNSLYHGRRIVARLSLADMANPAATTVHYNRAELTGTYGLDKAHFVQGAPGRMVLGSLDNDSTMRIFTWNDNNPGVPIPSTVHISSIPRGASYTSAAPDKSDWVKVGFPGNITGGTYRAVFTGVGPDRQEYLFAFTAGKNAGRGRPMPYVRLETLTPSDSGYQSIAEYDIWNTAYAFAMAGLGTTGGQIGVTLAVGGGTVGYPQWAVGFKGDFVVYQVTNSNATQTTRFGDFVFTRPIPGSNLFATEVYDVILNALPAGVTSGTCATVGVGCSAVMRFVQFGRPRVLIP